MASKIFLDLPGGLKMPALGYGTFLASDAAKLEAALNVALESGYRHIDTAYLYRNEAVVGKVLNQWFDSGKLKREDIFLTTKLPMFGMHPDRVEVFMKKSLENLGLDYVDLYLVHTPVAVKYDEKTGTMLMDDQKRSIPEEKTDHIGVWKKMEEQVDAGRTKTIGLSNYNISQIETVLKAARIKPANLQVQLHVYYQQPKLIDFCKRNDITIVAYFPLGNPSFSTFMESMGRGAVKLPNILGDPVVNKIAQKYSKTAAQIALRFLLQLGVATIPKSITPERIQENIDIFDFNLDEADFKELVGLDRGTDGRVTLFSSSEMANHPDNPEKE